METDLGQNIEIRRANERDENAIPACAEAAFAQYVPAIGRKPAPMVADFPSLIRSGSTYVAENRRNTLLGYIIFYAEGQDVMLDSVAVQPSATGRGVGRHLIAHCEQTARRMKARAVKLYTNEVMLANLSIYAHLGCRETERRQEDGFNRVYFEKRL